MQTLIRTRRPALRSEAGFSLVELLVVVLIVGILGAIALPEFLNQRSKSHDAETKVYLVAAQKALEIWHQEHDTYAGATMSELESIDNALERAIDPEVSGGERTYEVTFGSRSGAKGGGTFTVSREADGTFERTCGNAGKGACHADGRW